MQIKTEEGCLCAETTWEILKDSRIVIPEIKLGRMNTALANVSFLEHALGIVSEEEKGGKEGIKW